MQLEAISRKEHSMDVEGAQRAIQLVQTITQDLIDITTAKSVRKKFIGASRESEKHFPKDHCLCLRSVDTSCYGKIKYPGGT